MTYKKVKRADDRVARWTERIKRGPKAEMEGKEESVKKDLISMAKAEIYTLIKNVGRMSCDCWNIYVSMVWGEKAPHLTSKSIFFVLFTLLLVWIQQP